MKTTAFLRFARVIGSDVCSECYEEQRQPFLAPFQQQLLLMAVLLLLLVDIIVRVCNRESSSRPATSPSTVRGVRKTPSTRVVLDEQQLVADTANRISELYAQRAEVAAQKAEVARLNRLLNVLVRATAPRAIRPTHTTPLPARIALFALLYSHRCASPRWYSLLIIPSPQFVSAAAAKARPSQPPTPAAAPAPTPVPVPMPAPAPAVTPEKDAGAVASAAALAGYVPAELIAGASTDVCRREDGSADWEQEAIVARARLAAIGATLQPQSKSSRSMQDALAFLGRSGRRPNEAASIIDAASMRVLRV